MMNKRAFTLIELVITMLIIGILSVVVIAKVGDISTSAKENATRNEMKEIYYAICGNPEKGIAGYKDNMGHIPTAGEGGLNALIVDPTGGAGFNQYTQIGWNGPYVSNRDNDSNGIADILEDAWGNPYVYDAVAGTVTSYGDDEASGGGDDIVITLF